MLRANLDSRQLDVVSLARTISSLGAHCSDFPRLTLRAHPFVAGRGSGKGTRFTPSWMPKPTVRLGFTPGEARDKSVVNLGRWAHVAHRIYKPQSSRRPGHGFLQRREGRWREDLLLMLATMGPSRSLSLRTLCQAGSFWNAVHLVSRSASDSQGSM
jgi:hypothetical protein